MILHEYSTKKNTTFMQNLHIISNLSYSKSTSKEKNLILGFTGNDYLKIRKAIKKITFYMKTQKLILF